MKLVLDAPGLQSIGQAYTELKESHERLARTSRRRRLRDIAFQDAVQRLLSEIKKTAEGILGKKSNDADYPKRRLLQTLRHAFEQLDTDGSNTLSLASRRPSTKCARHLQKSTSTVAAKLIGLNS